MSPSPIKAAVAGTRRKGQQIGGPIPLKLMAAQFASGSDYFMTQTTGGEKGISTGAWGVFVMFDPRRPATGSRRIAANWVGSSGWTLDLLANGTLRVYMAETGSQSRTADLTLAATDYGRVLVVRLYWDGTTLRIERDRGLLGGATAMASYVPGGVSTGWNQNGENVANVLPYVPGYLYAMMSYSGSPSTAQVQAYYDAARNLGDLPSTFTGATVRHRWSLRDALASTSVITDGQTGPSTIADTITGATADAMARTGAPTVKVTDPAIDGRKSYGALGFDSASYMQASGIAALQGSASGIGLFGRVYIGAYASAEEFVVGSYGSNSTGWTLYTTPAGGGTLRIYVVGLGDIVLGALPPGSDVTWGFSWDGASYTGYLNGAIAVGPTAMTGFVRNTVTPFRVGQSSLGSNPSANTAVYLLAGCDSNLTATEQLALHESLRNTGTVSIPAGKTNPNVYDLTQDVTANGGPGAGLPATIANRAGGAVTLSRVGTGMQVARRTLRLWSYETSPVIQGFTPSSGSTYYETGTTGHDGGAASGKSFAVAFRLNAQTVNKSRELLSFGTDAGQKVSMRITGANAALTSSLWNGSAFVSPPVVAFSASDVGRLLLAVIQWDPVTQKARAFFKRGEVGTGTAMTAYAPGTGNWLRLGMIHTAGSYPAYYAEEVTIFGASTYDGVWSLAEIQAMYDALIAEEDLLAVSGKDGHRWSLKQAIGTSGALPASASDLAGGSSPLTRVGAPTLNAMYAHAA